MNLSVIILAAGEGKRMNSSLPKVLHPLAGIPILERVIRTAQALTVGKIHVVYGHQGERIQAALAHLEVEWVHQQQQLGTGHAVAAALANVDPSHQVLVLFGDVPLISPETLQRLLDASQQRLGLLVARVPDPFGLGRIVRQTDGEFMKIVEEKDATAAERAINEIFTGTLTAPAAQLAELLSQVSPNNAQGEYYLVDAATIAKAAGHPVVTVDSACAEEALGINDKKQLALLERYYQSLQADKLLLAGVTLMDPARIDIRGEVIVGRDVSIDVNVIIEGPTVIGDGCTIGAHTVLRRVRLDSGVQVRDHCVVEDATIGEKSILGPFARIRPDSILGAGVHVGNFVEIKKSTIGKGTKINHLSYIGDASVGKEVTIGAGTITCNYNGVDKHRTEIGDYAFIGSDTQLVAPVAVGEGATIGAGSTITRDCPSDQLTLSRVKQMTVTGWQRPIAKSSTD